MASSDGEVKAIDPWMYSAVEARRMWDKELVMLNPCEIVVDKESLIPLVEEIESQWDGHGPTGWAALKKLLHV